MKGNHSESLAAARRVDARCDEFELELATGKLPQIESFLSDIPAPERQELLLELLGLELDFRVARGELPKVGDYEKRFPELSAEQLASMVEASRGRVAVVPAFDSGVPSVDQPTILTQTDAVDAPSDQTATVPRRVRYFGDYELLREIARGGMGVVYEARQRSLNRPVALKMILSGQFASAEEVARFHREAEAAAQLEHPGIVPIYEIGTDGNQHFFSMAFVDGESLAKKMASGPLPPREAARLVKSIAEAVEYAHQKGIIHRDLKPANILLDRNGIPRITDFGLAKNIQCDSGMTATGQVMGTPSYMPPEQAAGHTTQVKEAADVYSLGAVLYAMLTGRPPFQADNVLDTLRQVLERDPVPPQQLIPTIPQDLETICLKCLQKEKHKRYQSAREFADDVERFEAGRPILARAVTRAEKLRLWCRRNPMVASLLAACVFLLLGGTAISTYYAIIANQKTNFANLKTEEAKTAATNATKAAVKAKQAELAEREVSARLRQNAYFDSIRLAKLYRDNFDIERALLILERCPEDLRDWEWDYVSRLCRAGYVARANHNEDHRAPGDIHQSGRQSETWQIDFVGSTIVSAGVDGRVNLWDAGTGAVLKSFDFKDHSFTSVRLSPDAKRIFAGTYFRAVLVINADTGQIESSFNSPFQWTPETIYGTIASLDYDSATDTLWFSQDGKVTAWRPGATEVTHVVQVGRGRTRLTISQDRREVFAFTNDGIRVIDLDSFQMVKTDVTSGDRSWIACDPNGRVFAIGYFREKNIEVWDAERRVVVATLQGHEGPVYSLDFSADGQELVSADGNGAVYLWDMRRFRLKRRLHGHSGGVLSVAFGPTNNILASISRSRALNLWDLATAQEPTNVAFTGALVRGKVSSSGRFIAGISLHPSVQRSVELYDLTTSTMKRILRTGHLPIAISFSPDESTVACSYSNRTLRLWNLATDNFQGAECQLTAVAEDLTFGADGKTLFAVGTDGNVSLVNPVDGSVTRTQQVSQVAVYCVVSDRSGKVCVTADNEGNIYVLNAHDGAVLRTLRGHSTRIDALTMSQDENTLCSGDWRGNIVVWDLKQGTEIHRLTASASQQRVSGLTFLGDSPRFAASSWDGTVRIWDARTGREILADSAHIEAIRRFLSSSDDGSVLVSGDWSGSVRVWHSKWSNAEQQQMSVNLKQWTRNEVTARAAQDVPPREVTRDVPPSEALIAAEASRSTRPLTNADFLARLAGWEIEEGGKEFILFSQHGERVLTTYGQNKDSDTGRIFQCFKIPDDAAKLCLSLHGGADSEKTYVAIWNGAQLLRRTAARQNHHLYRVEWDVAPFRGMVVTLEVVDRSTIGWGFIGVQGIELTSEQTPSPAIAPFDAVQATQHQEEWAKILDVPVEHTNSIGMKFRLIPPGQFNMGSTPLEIRTAIRDVGEDRIRQDWITSEGPQHKVILTKPFFLGTHEVTQSQYTHVVGRNPSFFCSTGEGKNSVTEVDTSKFPVENVDWNEIADFCNKLSILEEVDPVMTANHIEVFATSKSAGYRLPTQAEWEFSCRAGTTTTYSSGDKLEDLAKVGWFKGNSGGLIHPVGQLNANAFGLFDMHGNVWERTLDRWDPTLYKQLFRHPAVNPGQPSLGQQACVTLSGSFDFDACFSRSANRGPFNPELKFGNNGFRVALSVEAVKKSLDRLNNHHK